MYKAKQKTVSLLVACLTFFVTMVMAFACLFNAPTINVASAAGGNYVKVTAAPTDWSGEYLIVYETDRVAFDGSLSSLDAGNNIQKVTISNNTIEATDAMKKISFTIEKSGTSYTIKSASGYYIGNESDANKLLYNKSTKYTNTITLNSDKSVHIVGSGKSVLRFNASSGSSNYRFRYYKSSSYTGQKAIALYKLEAGGCDECTYTSYTYVDNKNGTHTKKGECTVCGTEAVINASENCSVITWSTWTPNDGSHTRTGNCQYCKATITETNDCEVTASGYVREGNTHSQTGTCGICGDETKVTDDCTLSYANVPNNDGTHNMTSTCSVCEQSSEPETIECTFEESLDDTTLTYTCKYCEYSYTEEATMFTITYVVPSGITAPEAVDVADGYTTKLVTADAMDGYTFEGWTTKEVEKSDSKPATVYAANYELTVTEDIKLYALYSYVDGAGSGEWEKVTNVSDLAVGKEIIIVNADDDYALSTNQKDSNRGATGFGADDVQIITLEEGTVDKTFAFNVGNGYLYAASSGSNHLKTQTSNNANGSWLITIEGGVTNIRAQGDKTRNELRFNPNNGSPLFSCYVTNSTTGSSPSIYMIAGDKYYTTGETVQPEPTPETKITAASLTLGTTLTMNYYVTLLDEHVGATMSITMTGEETKAVQGVFQEDGDYKGQYVFSFEIPPQYMATTINAQLVFEGETIAELNDYSIKKYAQNQLNKLNDNPNDELKQLLTDLLYYGDAAYNFVNKTTGETPVTSGVENIGTASLATSQTTFELVDNAEINEYPAYFVSAGVWFDNVNQLYVKLNTTENVTLKINGTAVAVTGKTVYTDGIFATDFDKEFTFELYHGETLMQTLKYSVNAYAKAMENDALALALYRYGASAEAYAN